MIKKYVIACSKRWFIDHQIRFVSLKKFVLITEKKKLNLKNLKKINPKYIFFPHWSFILKQEIYKNYYCIGFHSSDLPNGRGGSPIQNQILKGKKNTKITSIKYNQLLDSGDWIYKTKLNLSGDLDDIFKRSSKIIKNQINMIIKNKFKLKKQKGKIYKFKRLKISNSEIKKNESKLINIYDKIRMLDSEEYPRAYFKLGKIRIELSEAKYLKNKILCKAILKK